MWANLRLYMHRHIIIVPGIGNFLKGVIMPVRIKKVNGYRVSHGGKISAKHTTKAKAKSQARLLNAVKHGWKATGKKKK